jgi:hypothetical protein
LGICQDIYFQIFINSYLTSSFSSANVVDTDLSSLSCSSFSFEVSEFNGTIGEEEEEEERTSSKIITHVSFPTCRLRAMVPSFLINKKGIYIKKENFSLKKEIICNT